MSLDPSQVAAAGREGTPVMKHMGVNLPEVLFEMRRVGKSVRVIAIRSRHQHRGDDHRRSQGRRGGPETHRHAQTCLRHRQTPRPRDDVGRRPKTHGVFSLDRSRGSGRVRRERLGAVPSSETGGDAKSGKRGKSPEPPDRNTTCRRPVQPSVPVVSWTGVRRPFVPRRFSPGLKTNHPWNISPNN